MTKQKSLSYNIHLLYKEVLPTKISVKDRGVWLVEALVQGTTRFDGARGKKKVWRPHVRT